MAYVVALFSSINCKYLFHKSVDVEVVGWKKNCNLKLWLHLETNFQKISPSWTCLPIRNLSLNLLIPVVIAFGILALELEEGPGFSPEASGMVIFLIKKGAKEFFKTKSQNTIQTNSNQAKEILNSNPLMKFEEKLKIITNQLCLARVAGIGSTACCACFALGSCADAGDPC